MTQEEHDRLEAECALRLFVVIRAVNGSGPADEAAAACWHDARTFVAVRSARVRPMDTKEGLR